MATNTHNKYTNTVVKAFVGNEGQFSVDEVTVAVTADTELGDVLYNNAGTWTLVNAANVDSAAGVLVDPRLQFGVGANTDFAAGNHTLQVARRNVLINRDSLNYASDVDTAPERTSAETALLALGVKVVESY